MIIETEYQISEIKLCVRKFTTKPYELNIYLYSRDAREPDKTRKRVALCESIRFVLTFFGSFFVSRQKMNVKNQCTLLGGVSV